ncbi:sugar ABC transporter substrate-binding protein [Methylobrevis albus]|uniref:Substrate-binding domain-containing protein n=1 Tax=Methylobrevis albus TaxID=2793297 RepID=A0A931N1J6_9HYPH|nr:substrate-binding domain-containing protein [Methylobrevis albus]MBH0239891.1 substrate-binding domain-containing protein [Methylobrevis albus]
MKMLTRLATGVALAATLAFSAAPAFAEPMKIGFSTITLADRFFVRLQDGMDTAAARHGATMIYNNPDGNPAAQVTAIENFITQQVDAIIVDAIDPNGIQPVLRQAREAGIPVIAVDEVLDGFENITAGVGLDNHQLGVDIGARMLAYADENGIEKLYIGDIHTLDAPIENTRSKGLAEFVAQHPDRMEIVGTVDAKFSSDAAATGGENLLSANPQLNMFFGSGGGYLIGALAAVRSQGATDRVKLVGLDFMPQLIEALEQGIYVVAAETNPELMGEGAVDVAVKLAKGEAVERNTGIPVEFRSVADLDELKAKFSE